MTVAVLDPYGVSADPAMPFLADATDPAHVERHFRRLLSGGARFRGVHEIRVVRHKPGRRCIVEYDVEIHGPDLERQRVTFVGKARARGSPNDADALLRQLRLRGFGDDAPDGFCVPEPLGVVRPYRMSLQRKAPGRSAAQVLGECRNTDLARGIAEAVCKLHRAGIVTRRSHTIVNEIAILREKLGELALTRPDRAPRLRRALEGCERLAALLPMVVPRGIHRDFYADQVLADGRRLYLLDFDLYCQGDPALDAGNFLGHLTELALRRFGDPAALSDVEAAFEERFVELSGTSTQAAVRAYATLTIVRHVYLSTLFPERRQFTGDLLELAEERLDARPRTRARMGVS